MKLLQALLFLTFVLMLTNVATGQYHKSIHQEQHEIFRELYRDIKTEPYGASIPIQARRTTPSREVFGYHPYWMGTAWQSYNFNLISTIAYFGLETNGSGNIVDHHGWPVTSLINEAHSYGTEVSLGVILFNSDNLAQLLSSPSNRQTLINNLLTEVNDAGADGVNIDFEGVPSSQRNNLTTFMTDLTAAFHEANPASQVTMATPAVDWSNAFDYDALAEACDGLMIMGYAYHWGGSPTAGPVSPLSGWGTYNITWTVNDYLTKTGNDRDKIILGLPYYGYEWPTTSGSAGASTTGNGDAKFYSEAIALAESYGPLWNDESQTPWYRYQDGNNNWHQGWYDDSLSLSLKYELAIDEDLLGIGIWALGYDGTEPELWGALADHFGASAPPTTPTNLSIINIGDGSVQINFSTPSGASEFNIYSWLAGNSELLATFSSEPVVLTNLTEDELYYFQISAVNEYGESPMTEVLGVIPTSEEVPILVVNGFDRVNGTTNTFDFIRRHGPAIQAAGVAFDACANEVVESGSINLNDYFIVDWILGEEGTATSSFTAAEQAEVMDFLEAGRGLFVSGSEIGYDLVAQGDAADYAFYTDYLKSVFVSDAAGGQQGTYEAFGTDGGIFSGFSSVTFDNGSHGTYDVDWPDGIKPTAGSAINLKYNNVDYSTKGGAGIEYIGNFGGSSSQGGVVHLAIPFETIYPEESRNAVMSEMMNYFYTNLQLVTDPTPLPQTPSITAIYPNPANLQVNILIQISQGFQAGTSIIKILDILGRSVAEIPLTALPTTGGELTVKWNGKTFAGEMAASGTYTVLLKSGGQSYARKFTLLK